MPIPDKKRKIFCPKLLQFSLIKKEKAAENLSKQQWTHFKRNGFSLVCVLLFIIGGKGRCVYLREEKGFGILSSYLSSFPVWHELFCLEKRRDAIWSTPSTAEKRRAQKLATGCLDFKTYIFLKNLLNFNLSCHNCYLSIPSHNL